MDPVTIGLFAARSVFGAYSSIKEGQIRAANFQRRAYATEAETAFQLRQIDFNRSMLLLQEADTYVRRDRALADTGKEAKQMYGAQRVAFAAQGVDIASGSAFEVEEDTRRQVKQRLTDIENSAWREAFGLRAQAAGYEIQSLMTQNMGRMKADMYRQEAGDAWSAGLIGAAGAVLGGAVDASRGRA